MTRINLVAVEELSDQHLLAEYRVLPRFLKQNINTKDAPLRYKLGTGHIKWAKRYSKFVWHRFALLVDEMQYRGFKTTFTELPESLIGDGISYVVAFEDYLISRDRLISKYREKPTFYKWTKRDKPRYMTIASDNNYYVWHKGKANRYYRFGCIRTQTFLDMFKASFDSGKYISRPFEYDDKTFCPIRANLKALNYEIEIRNYTIGLCEKELLNKDISAEYSKELEDSINESEDMINIFNERISEIIHGRK